MKTVNCPFCKGDDTKVLREDGERITTRYVVCNNCGACGPTEAGASEERAIVLWNARPLIEISGSTMMLQRKTWNEFRRTGLMWWVNRMLHTFGWALVVTVDEAGGTVNEAFPARVKFRGFSTDVETDGFRKLTRYMGEEQQRLMSDFRSDQEDSLMPSHNATDSIAILLQERIDHHDQQESMADATDADGPARYHRAIRKELQDVLQVAGTTLLKCGDPIPEGGCGCRHNGVPIMRANCSFHTSK